MIPSQLRIRSELKKKGYTVVRNALDQELKDEILNVTDEFAFKLIKKWGNVILKKNIHKDIVNIYLKKNKPNYRRNPDKNLRNKLFFSFINNDLFLSLKDILKKNFWHFSFYKNLRFKSSVLPWSNENWHCDRYVYEKDFYKKNFNFVIVWIPLQNMDENGRGGLEVIKKNKFFNINFFKRQKKLNPSELHNCSDIVKNNKSFKTAKPKLKFGDILIMDSYTIHKTNPIKSKKPFWSMDLRFEFDKNTSYETKVGGFNYKNTKNYNYRKFINYK